jgi:hypothetical protein
MRFSAAIALVLAGTGAQAASPAALLGAVAANARFPTATRADVRLESTQDHRTTEGAAVFIGRGRTLYVETRDGTRALVRPSKILVRSGRRVVRSAPGARLGKTDVRLEDLVPVTAAMFKLPQVSDEGPTGTVITGAPAFPSARALIVLTIDPDTAVVTRVKYYEKSISDLAAFRRDEDFADVDGHRRPTRITIDRPADASTTRLALTWRAAPETSPLLFTPRGLLAPSPITW